MNMAFDISKSYFDFGSEPSVLPSSLDLIASIALLYASKTPCCSKLPNDYVQEVG